MSKNAINCFIAMAFGRDDCNEVYKNYIYPILKELGISPIRVDRRQHKDDLNNYIIRMLNDSEIALVDLTYARPSVYYEAGYAERHIPVIYTARTDHLSRAQDDDRLRVHFDLEMKKIVDWKNPNDRTFKKRLKQRASYLLKPIKYRHYKDFKEEEAINYFHSLSVKSKNLIIMKTFKLQFKKTRFWQAPISDINQYIAWNLKPAIGMVGAKRVGSKCIYCFVLASETITKKQLEHTINSANASILISRKQKPEIKIYEENYFFCSLKKIPEQRLTSTFPSAKPFHEEGCYRMSKRFGYQKLEHNITIWPVDSLNSIPHIQDQAKSLFAKQENKKSNSYTRLIRTPNSNIAEIFFGRTKI